MSSSSRPGWLSGQVSGSLLPWSRTLSHYAALGGQFVACNESESAKVVMKPVARVLVALGSSLTLLGYIVVLALRILSRGPGHIGSDVIAGCYVLGVLGVVAAGSLYGATLQPRIARIRSALLAFSIIVAALWASFHVGGFVYSHESMFRAQPNPSIEGTSTSGLRPLAAAPHVQR